jgi:predicted nicotinamide N-methyase
MSEPPRVTSNATTMTPGNLAVRRLRLLRRIESRYPVVTGTVTVGRLTFPFTRIADPDLVLDEVAAEEDRLEKLSGKRADGDYLHLPYWAELWDSAAGIAAWLTENLGVQLQRGPNVLDLGCGMGLSGTVAAALGARVLFADLEAPALLFARLNSLPWAGHVRARRVDWRADRLTERFDVIIGADILYERKQWDHLDPFWRAHLAPGGTVLLGEPGRPTGDVFPDWIRHRGWKLTTVEQTVPTRLRPIRLFLLRNERGPSVLPLNV